MSNVIHEVNALNDAVLFQQQENNNNLNNRIFAKKCLFGPSNLVEVTKLLDENICIERERFKEKFGVDIEIVEKKFDSKKEVKRLVIKVGHSSNDLKKKNELRGVLKPHNKQLKVTEIAYYTN
ncbi:transposable element-related [Holotrichia oblita]|uniref:Transposable element-related n=1 Tax=Holotrichia oblita TaxID=644536 RepID=A0ACB9T7U8_HOLOL|nr:transposable element-related [Holotrichia oblita]